MNIRPIILVSSCKSDREKGYHDVIRRTWGKVSLIPYLFFTGDTGIFSEDEISLDCPDNYFSLPLKTQLSVKVAIKYGYTHFFRAFTDTYIDTGRLLKSGFEAHEYVGNMCGFHTFGFMHGGPGYWLGPLAGQIIANGNPTNEQYEDQWVGRMMQIHKVPFIPDYRYSLGTSYKHREQSVLMSNDIITEHLSTSSIFSDSKEKYEPHMMESRHIKRFPNLHLGSF